MVIAITSSAHKVRTHRSQDITREVLAGAGSKIGTWTLWANDGKPGIIVRSFLDV